MRLDRFRQIADTPMVPLTAMIDVLFLMIIFLVLGSDFDPVTGVKLPRAKGGETVEGVLRVELRPGGQLWLEGTSLPAASAVEELRRRAPGSLMLLPDRSVDVDTLFRWYDRLDKELDVPVSVGVRPPDS